MKTVKLSQKSYDIIQALLEAALEEAAGYDRAERSNKFSALDATLTEFEDNVQESK